MATEDQEDTYSKDIFETPVMTIVNPVPNDMDDGEATDVTLIDQDADIPESAAGRF